MPTTYTINVTSNSFIPGSAPDPQVTIISTVSAPGIQTVEVTTFAWLGALTQAKAQGGLAAVSALIAPGIIAAALAAQPVAPVPPTQLPTGQFQFTQ